MDFHCSTSKEYLKRRKISKNVQRKASEDPAFNTSRIIQKISPEIPAKRPPKVSPGTNQEIVLRIPLGIHHGIPPKIRPGIPPWTHLEKKTFRIFLRNKTKNY